MVLEAEGADPPEGLPIKATGPEPTVQTPKITTKPQKVIRLGGDHINDHNLLCHSQCHHVP